MPDPAESQTYVIVEHEDIDEVRAWAAEHGVAVETVETRALEPVSAVTLLLLGSALAVSAVAQLVDRSKGGQVIDLQPGSPRMVYRSRDVTYGLIVIIALDGTVKVDVKEPKGMFGQVVDSITEVVAELGKSGIDAIGTAVKAQVGDHADVSTTPAPLPSTE